MTPSTTRRWRHSATIRPCRTPSPCWRASTAESSSIPTGTRRATPRTRTGGGTSRCRRRLPPTWPTCRRRMGGSWRPVPATSAGGSPADGTWTPAGVRGSGTGAAARGGGARRRSTGPPVASRWRPAYPTRPLPWRPTPHRRRARNPRSSPAHRRSGPSRSWLPAYPPRHLRSRSSPRQATPAPEPERPVANGSAGTGAAGHDVSGGPGPPGRHAGARHHPGTRPHAPPAGPRRATPRDLPERVERGGAAAGVPGVSAATRPQLVRGRPEGRQRLPDLRFGTGAGSRAGCGTGTPQTGRAGGGGRTPRASTS